MSASKHSNLMICQNCGGQLNIDKDKETVSCPYCRTKYSYADFTSESEAVRLEKLKARQEEARYQMEHERLQHEEQKRRHDEEGRRRSEQKERRRERNELRLQEKLKKREAKEAAKSDKSARFQSSLMGRFLVILIIIGLLQVAYCFPTGRLGAGCMAVFQIGLFMVAYFNGMGEIKGGALLRILLTVLGIALYYSYIDLLDKIVYSFRH